MKQVKLTVEGMSCGHCVSAVKQALAGVAGVQVESVAIGSAVLQMDELTATLTNVLEAVSDAGYTADEAVAS